MYNVGLERREEKVMLFVMVAKDKNQYIEKKLKKGEERKIKKAVADPEEGEEEEDKYYI